MRGWLSLLCVLALGHVHETGDQVGSTPLVGGAAGSITSADSGAPIPGAIVTLTNADRAGSPLIAETDRNGSFNFQAVPVGRYNVRATKPGWLESAFGSGRPGSLGVPVVLSAGVTTDGVNIKLPRAGVITGVVRDPAGEGIPAALVTVLRVQTRNGARHLIRLGDSGEVFTDQAGEYRVFGLFPGDYLVMCCKPAGQNSRGTEIGQLSRDAIDVLRKGATDPAAAQREIRPAKLTVPVVFYPGVSNIAQANVVSLTPGEQRTGVDLSVTPVPAARLAGQVVGMSDVPSGRTEIRLTPLGAEHFVTTAIPTPVSRANSAGRFEFTGIPQGTYHLFAASAVPGTGAQGYLSAWHRSIVVIDRPEVDISVSLAPAVVVSGRVVSDGGAPATTGTVILQPAGEAAAGTRQSAPIEKDGTFRFPPLIPGAYWLELLDPSGKFYLRGAITKGVDAFDRAIQVDGALAESEFLLSVTASPTELIGSLQDRQSRPASDYYVVVFPRLDSDWTVPSRRVSAVRPDTQGRFSVRGLPAGEYLVSAMTDLEPDEWFSRQVLEELAGASVAVTLAYGRTIVQDLKLKR